MPHTPGPHPDQALTFGTFRLLPAQKLLLDGEQPVRLGSRAMELLLALVEQAGQVLSREQLEARVWPRTVVEETSLRVHISALRKALREQEDGHPYITNVPGRGYCFVARVMEAPAGVVVPQRTRAGVEPPASNLPSRLTRVVGRMDVVEALGTQLARRRLVSIVGAGGIGKTTVAMAVAAAREHNYEDGVRFVDLAPLSDPQLVAGALALAVGIPIAAKTTLSSLCAFLGHRRMLIILDNCEHVIEAAASLVETLMRAAPDLHILATTREPLYAEGEWIHRLASLETPAVGASLTVEQALAFSAIELFVERAAASSDGFALSAETLPAVRQLCHQLDGVPLAIELAAARVDGLGVLGLAQKLDELFQLLTRGRRTALPRHRTLEALIDWSYQLLTPTERRVLARLAVFRAGFTLAAAASVASDDDIPPDAVTDIVLGLTAKSLVNVESQGDIEQHRLLYMTREYAERKLQQDEDSASVRMKHARHLRDMCLLARTVFGDRTEQERASNFVRMIDDIRAALVWAYSEQGDDAIAVQLTASVRVRIFSLGMGAEDRKWIELGLSRVARLSPAEPLLELRLCVAWCFLSGHTDGMAPQQPEMFERTTALLDLPGAGPLRIEALYSMCVGSLGQGRYRILADMAQRVRQHAEGEDAALGVLIGGRMQVFARHYLGQHDAAHELVDGVVAHPVERRHQWCVSVPNSVSVRIVEARILWVKGEVGRAISVIQAVLKTAEHAHPFGMSQALAMAAIPIAIWSGDAGQAGAWVDALEDQARQGAVGFWHSWVPGFRHAIRRMDAAPGDRARAKGPEWQLPDHWAAKDLMGSLSEDLVSEETVARVESGEVAWCGPEILRAQGENLLRREGEGAALAAEGLFQRALDMARHHRALSWELRAALSLARLWQARRRDDARRLLEAVLDRYKLGLGTMDARRAGELLMELSS